MNILGPIPSASVIDRDRARAEPDSSPSDEATSGFAALLPFAAETSQATKASANASSSAIEATGSTDASRANVPALAAQQAGKPVPDGPPPSGKSLPDGAPTSLIAKDASLISRDDGSEVDRLSKPDRAAIPSALAGRAEPAGEATHRAGRSPGARGILSPEMGNPRAAQAPSHSDSIASRRELAFEAPMLSSAIARGGAGVGSWVVPPPSPLSPPADPTLDRSAVGSRGGETGAPGLSAPQLQVAARSATGAPAVVTDDGQNGDASRGARTASLPRADNALLPRATAPIDGAIAEESDAENSLRAPRKIDERSRPPVAPGAPVEGLRIRRVEATGRMVEGSIAQSPSIAAPGANLANSGQSQPSSLPQAGAPSDMMRADRIEAMIDQLTHQREGARALRGSMTVTHAEFGAIAIRIEGQGSDLRAHLSNRDPAFAPAVHHALETRAAASAGDTAGAGARHSETGQNGSTGSQQSSSQGAWAQAQGGGANHQQDPQHRIPSRANPLGQEQHAELGDGRDGGSPRAGGRDRAIFA